MRSSYLYLITTAPPAVNGGESKNMSALITSVEHALAVAASDTVTVAKFVDASVLPVLKKVQADQVHHRGRDVARQLPGGQHRARRIRSLGRGDQGS